jgi:hypothetical protein
MIRLLAACLALALALSAQADCVWTKTTGPYEAKAVCADGDEPAPALSSDGIPLAGIESIGVTVSADAGQTFTAAPAGTIAVYIRSEQTGRWARCQDCNEGTIKNASVRDQPFTFTVTHRRGRVAFVPIGVTLSAGGLTIWTQVDPVRR